MLSFLVRACDRKRMTQTAPPGEPLGAPWAPHAPHAPGIVAEHVSRAFGSVQAVHDLSFTAPRGAVPAPGGPKGCAKSTRMLLPASLLVPDGGGGGSAGWAPAA